MTIDGFDSQKIHGQKMKEAEVMRSNVELINTL